MPAWQAITATFPALSLYPSYLIVYSFNGHNITATLSSRRRGRNGNLFSDIKFPQQDVEEEKEEE